MNAYIFIKNIGLGQARKIVEQLPTRYGVTHYSIICQFFYRKQTNGFWLEVRNTKYGIETSNRQSEPTALILLAELKQAIADWDLVNLCGGIERCKQIIHTRNECKPKATHFCIHPIETHLIQLYRSNEPKYEPNYRIKDVEQAMNRVVEGAI